MTTLRPLAEIHFEMSGAERTSPLWQRMRPHLERQLERLRAENDNPRSTEHETAARRGHIECLKAILRLGNERPDIGNDEAAETTGHAE